MSGRSSGCLTILALLLAVGGVNAQQVPASGTRPLRSPTFASERGPTVAIDEAHKNTHTFASPQFRGLVDLLQADGYRVRPLSEGITGSSLAGIDVLLLSGPGGWLTPDESLSEREIADLMQWLARGGSLLLLLDHMPAPRNSARLTRALGVREWHNGYTLVQVADSLVGPIIFWREGFLPADAPVIGPTGPGGGLGYQGQDAILAKHPITDGRNPDEQVRRVATFVGSAFEAPAGAEVLLTLPQRSASFMPPETPNAVPVINMATPHLSVANLVQGVVLTIGRGRVALFGETGLFSGGPAADNQAFVLNVLHWLSGLL